MSQEQPQKRLKPQEAFFREDAPFKRSHGLKLIADGTIRTVRIGKRRYIDMTAWQRQEAGLPPIAAE